MIEEKAVVIKSEDGVAWVQTGRKTACGGCSLNKGCGVSVLERMLGERVMLLKALDPISTHQGDEVVIGIRESALVKGSVVVYILPLLAMILFAMLGSTVVAPWLGLPLEGTSIVMGGAGLGVGFWGVSLFSRRIRQDSDYQPVILRVVDREPLPERYIPITRV